MGSWAGSTSCPGWTPTSTRQFSPGTCISPWPRLGPPSSSRMELPATSQGGWWPGSQLRTSLFGTGLARAATWIPLRISGLQENSLQEVQASQEPGPAGSQHEEGKEGKWATLLPLWLHGEEDHQAGWGGGWPHQVLNFFSTTQNFLFQQSVFLKTPIQSIEGINLFQNLDFSSELSYVV